MDLLLVSSDRLAPSMTATGIRYAALADALAARGLDVVVAAPEGSAPVGGTWPLRTYDPAAPRSLRPLLRAAGAVFAPPLAPRAIAPAAVRGRWIVDLLNPEPFEGLEYHRGRRPAVRAALATLRLDRLNFAMRTGATFLCATERQRDMWLGMLAANRRLDPSGRERDPELRALVDVLPSGLPAGPPPRSAGLLRGRLVAADARILLWNGGIWDWLDPVCAVRAVGILHAEDPRWRLVFQSTGRASARGAMRAASDTGDAVRELGLADAVVLHDAWVPAAERGAWLADADAVLSAHPASAEARFAHRSRLLDAVWAGVPVAASRGDALADRMAELGVAATAAPGDAAGLAEAARTAVGRGRTGIAPGLAVLRGELGWERAAERLARAFPDPGRRSRGIVGTALGVRHGLASRVRPAG